MEFDKTEFPFFHDECIKQFGCEKGEKIFKIADEKLLKMKNEADYKNSKAIKVHMNFIILPGIAIYSTFKELNFTNDSAYKNTLKIIQIAAERFKEKNQSLSKIPFFYRLFKLACKPLMKKFFPIEGWDVEWKRCDKKEIHFNIKRCIYTEITEQYNCSELCSVFCEHDVIAYSGYAPKILFKREGTIGQGQKVCDFHYINGK